MPAETRGREHEPTLPVGRVKELLDAVTTDSEADTAYLLAQLNLPVDESASLEGRIHNLRSSLSRWCRRGQELSALFSSARARGTARRRRLVAPSRRTDARPDGHGCHIPVRVRRGQRRASGPFHAGNGCPGVSRAAGATWNGSCQPGRAHPLPAVDVRVPRQPEDPARGRDRRGGDRRGVGVAARGTARSRRPCARGPLRGEPQRTRVHTGRDRTAERVRRSRRRRAPDHAAARARERSSGGSEARQRSAGEQHDGNGARRRSARGAHHRRVAGRQRGRCRRHTRQGAGPAGTHPGQGARSSGADHNGGNDVCRRTGRSARS